MFELDDVFDDELDLGGEPQPVIPQKDDDLFDHDDPFVQITKTNEDDSIINDLLKARGIDGSKIIILDEDNEQKEVDFYSLTKEEQLEILNSQEENVLSTEEEKFLKQLKDNNLTIETFLEKYKEEITSQLNQTIEPTYDIDNYDDQELFLLDLKSKYDLTDEELTAELEKELQNEELFKKKTSKLREEYKKLEDEYNQEKQNEFNKEREEQYNQFVDTMVDIAVKTPEFHGIELEDTEKNEVLSFLLDLDDNGVSEFYRSLNNPTKLYEAAWFLRYGKDAFEAIKNAYETEITKLKDGKKIVVRKDSDKQANSIHDLF